MRGYYILFTLSLLLFMVSSKDSTKSGKAKSDKLSDGGRMRMKFFKLTKPAAPEVIEMEDLANMTDDDAINMVMLKLKSRVAVALKEDETDIDDVIISDLADSLISNSTVEEIEGQMNSSLCCSTGIIFGERMPEKRCYLPRAVFKNFKGSAVSKKCMQMHAKCCEKIRGDKKRGKGKKHGMKKASNKKSSYKQMAHGEKAVSKVKTTPKKELAHSKKSNKKFTKNKNSKSSRKNIKLDDLSMSVELELDEEIPEIPDETGQQIEIHEKQAKLEVTFAKSKSDKQNSRKCCQAGKDYRKSMPEGDCEQGSITDPTIVADELCLAKFSFCCKKEPTHGKENMKKREKAVKEVKTNKNSAGVPKRNRAQSKKVDPVRERKLSNKQLPDGMKRHPNGQYYYVDSKGAKGMNKKTALAPK